MPLLKLVPDLLLVCCPQENVDAAVAVRMQHLVVVPICLQTTDCSTVVAWHLAVNLLLHDSRRGVHCCIWL